MRIRGVLAIGIVLVLGYLIAVAADIVPNEIQQPGTQPGEANLESVDRCDNCHGGYDPAVEPAHIWRGSMMAHAGRDPIFWATMAVAEQDFDGAGDLCIRCHATVGWLGGNSTPTDGSGLAASDDNGVECDFCHKMTNPDDSEHLGEQNAPFVANDGGSPPVGYYGSGMASIWTGNEKLGPYADAVPKHQWAQSLFHRSVDFCGSCHDVSNPAVGDLAPNHGTQPTADPVVASGVPGDPVDSKAAFNNFPYQYGIVERTFSEHKASVWPTTLVSDYPSLPAELQAGAIQTAYTRAIVAGTGGNYEDDTARYFSCQTCHVPPVTGVGANKAGTPTRHDLPLHDMTGGNYWMPDAIQYLDTQGKLRLGGGLSDGEVAGLNAGKARALQQLDMAASLEVNGDTVKITNLTGHKLISGYPEGRRMWLRTTWYDGSGGTIRVDGEYGEITATIDGAPTQVETILDLDDPNTVIYEAHYGMTAEWASALLTLGYPPALPLSYDRVTGDPDYTLGNLAAEPAGTSHETFHFVLNNTVVKDNRIPPYGMDYEKARQRNALPVPAEQYGLSGPGGTYDHFDLIALDPPSGAVSATIELLYQPTSWEYIQFLNLANDGSIAFLADEGANMLEAWLNTAMAPPHVMASATWGAACSESAPLAADIWKLFSLACDVSAGNTVEQALGGLDPADYPDRWRVWRRDEAANAYVLLALDDTLEAGRGYWIKTLDSGQTLTVGGDFNAQPLDVDLVAVANGRWNMAGFPFVFSLPWSSVRVVDGASVLTLDEADPELAGVRACSESPPRADCVMSRLAYTWSGAAYDAFDGDTPGMEGVLNPFDGLWVKAFKTGIALRFSLEEPASSGRGAVEARPDGSWFVRLVAESGALTDAGNVLGQLPDSSDGKDPHDLVEMPAFGERYLSIVFPHDDWGEYSGNYASDFHELGSKPSGAWTFAVLASAAVDQVVLRWEGPQEVLKKAWLIDLQTGERMKADLHGSYAFDCNGAARTFRFVVGTGSGTGSWR